MSMRSRRGALCRRASRVVGAIAAALFVAFAGLACGAAHADPATNAGAGTGWIDWNGDNFFRPCNGDCAFSLYGGGEVTTSMLRIFFLKAPPALPWSWHWGHSAIGAATFSRRLVTFWHALSLEPEFGVGQRFGDMHATEFWGAVDFRWTEFPWNNYIKTSIAISEGISLTTQVDTRERLMDNYRIVGNKLVFRGSDLLNFFSPEITFALPQYQDYELVVRFHHRSGIFGAINGVHAGAQFFTAGLRIHF